MKFWILLNNLINFRNFILILKTLVKFFENISTYLMVSLFYQPEIISSVNPLKYPSWLLSECSLSLKFIISPSIMLKITKHSILNFSISLPKIAIYWSRWSLIPLENKSPPTQIFITATTTVVWKLSKCSTSFEHATFQMFEVDVYILLSQVLLE